MKTIKLSNSDDVVLVSDIDFDEISRYKWFLKRAKSPIGQGHIKYYYAARSKTITTNGKRKVYTIWLHRFIMGNPKGFDVHHKDRNKLNCQRENLEILSPITHGSISRESAKSIPF